MLEKDIREVLVTRAEIQAMVESLGQQLTQEYQEKDLLVVGILKGASFFMADLVREMDLMLEIDYMATSSYGDAIESSGEVKILKDLDTTVKNRHILIVEDIVDTGTTLKYLIDLFSHRQAASIKVCALLDKPSRREKQVQADYVGMTIPNEFVVGYGLDYGQKYRNLPYIGVLKEAVYQN